MKLLLRKLNKKDLEYVYKLRNDNEAKKNSFNKNAIKFSEHKSWFLNKIKDKYHNNYIYI